MSERKIFEARNLFSSRETLSSAPPPAIQTLLRADELSAMRPPTLMRLRSRNEDFLKNEAETESAAWNGAGKREESADGESSTDELMSGGAASLYLHEIARIKLLTGNEEVALAKQLEAGKEALARLASGNFSPAEQSKLESVIKQGEEARNNLTEANLRLVVSVARKYMGRGLPFLDLVQEGNIGLSRGVDKFDYKRGFKFSTYAYWWIRQSVSRAVAEQSRTVRLPVHVVEHLSKIFIVARELERDLGRQPTHEEIGQHAGFSADKVEELLRLSRVPVSLETPVGTDSESIIADLVADPEDGPADQATETVFGQDLDRLIEKRLTPKEADVLRLRYGLKDNEERTLAEVGRMLGVSRERARQLEAEAFRKLRGDATFRKDVQEEVG